MDNVARNSVLIELHVEDFEPIKEYYCTLGFVVVWERPPEEKKGYLVLKLDDNILCFWPGTSSVHEQSYFKKFPKHTTRGYGVELVIIIKDLEAFYESHKDTLNVVEPLKTQPWGLKDFRATDPSGYYLRFTSPHNILDPSNAVQ